MERFHEIERVSVTARPTGVCRLGGVRTPPTSSPDVNKTMLNRCIIDDAVARCGSMFVHLRLYNQLYIVQCSQLIVQKSYAKRAALPPQGACPGPGVPCVPRLPAFPPGAVGWVCRGPSVPPRPPQPTPERTDDTRLKTVFGWASLIGEMITFSHPEALSCSSLHRALEDENYVLAIGPVVAHESIDDLIERVLQLPLHALAHVKHAGLPVGCRRPSLRPDRPW